MLEPKGISSRRTGKRAAKRSSFFVRCALVYALVHSERNCPPLIALCQHALSSAFDAADGEEERATKSLISVCVCAATRWSADNLITNFERLAICSFI